MPPLRMKIHGEPLKIPTRDDSGTSASTRESRHMEQLKALNEFNRRRYGEAPEQPVKRGTDDELPSVYSVAEIQELNRLRREGSTVSLAERVQHRGENVDPTTGRLQVPSDITPSVILREGDWPRIIETLRKFLPVERYAIQKHEDGSISIYDRNEAVEATHNPEPEHHRESRRLDGTAQDARDRLIMADQTRDMPERLSAMQRLNHRKWERTR